ncbi:MAG: chalcone isomerase family protein [Terriglobales bacterium]
MICKARMFLAIAVCCLTLFFNVHLFAADLAGVTLPDTVQVGSRTLVLNGLGLRTKFVVKVYVAGLYLPQKSADAEGIVKADAPKRLVMQFARSVSKKQVADGFTESFDDNVPEAKRTVGVDIEHFMAALEAVKEGDQMIFTYIPDAGTTFAINGKEKLTIPGLGFSQALFSVWLGPKPPTAGLKKGILGQ